ncbi:MAG: hypothetical protein JW809_03760 [Pirellulales bacterium]|nr:hypothetical protein [Pirellulales bacterium]
MNANSLLLRAAKFAFFFFILSIPDSLDPARAGEELAATGQAFDAAPFADARLSEDEREYSLRWDEPRRIRQVIVAFAPDAAPATADGVRLQYWHRHWNGLADPPASEVNPCEEGWRKIDDWTNGGWKDADARVTQDGPRWTFAFAPTGEKEFPRLGAPGVPYRKTLMIRLRAKAALPAIQSVHALTDGATEPMTVRILWDVPAVASLAFEGEEEARLDAYNGQILGVEPIADCPVKIEGRRATIPAGMRGGVTLRLAVAAGAADDSPDRTVVTVRSARRPFSFTPNELLLGRRILIDDLGVLVTKGDDAVTVAGWRETLREIGHKTVYDRVAEADEQTLGRARDEMPLKQPLYFVHGLPGNRNVFRQDPHGDLAVSSTNSRHRWNPSPRDSERQLWRGGYLDLGFGFPAGRCGGRELAEGYLPRLRTWWQDGPVFYEQTTILGKLQGDLDSIVLDDPTVLFMRVRAVNTSATELGGATLALGSRDGGGVERLEIDGQRVFVRGPNDQRLLRYLLHSPEGSQTVSEGRGLRWSAPLKPGESRELFFAIPSITLTDDKEIADLAECSFDAESQALVEYWRKVTSRSAEIVTPEPWLNDFHKAHARHLEVNCLRDLDKKSSRRYATVGSFHYGVFPNESVMMITDLDRRGMHKAAEDCLQSMLDFQGTVALPGNFQDREGVFYGADGIQMGGYNKNQGYVLWGLAEHWRYTRDRAWMERVAPNILAACEWIIRERKATMHLAPDGTKPLEYGFLPAGGLEDVQDFWYWQATNTAAVWGFDAAADALADFGHPEAKRLRAEANAYHDDVMRGLTEARVRTPVARLRDGTYVPKYPSHLHLRTRAGGWIRETLEGSMFLPVYGLIPADAPETAWILKDYEDNLYISDRYGYSIPTFERFWFSRGGFSMQANLLDGPLPYLYRDDVKHFLRAFFNGFASAFYPETKMLNEHSKPELGYPAGDHFKTSDEAQVAYWLRLMFVREAGDMLYLGQAIPRYWLRDGIEIGIRRAATHFGPMSVVYQPSPRREGKIVVELDPPRRNPPKAIYLRLRHPEEKPIKSVTVNGKPYDKTDLDKKWIVLPLRDLADLPLTPGRYIEKEWIILPGDLGAHQTIVVRY